VEFIEVFPAAEGRPLRPLVATEFAPPWLRDAHQQRETFGALAAQGVWAIENLTVAGYQSHMFVGGERFADPGVVPSYFEESVASGRLRPGDSLALPERVIDEPAVVFMGWSHNVYGHALVDMAPKIRIAAAALGVAAGRLTFLLASNATPWFRKLVAFAGAERFVEYDQGSERVLLRRAWVVTQPVDMAVHPACAPIFAAMRPPPSAREGQAVFLTRRTAQTTRRVQLLNAGEIESVAERAGMSIVSPEALSIADQAQLFADARLIVGEYGSALNNAVFCRPEAVIGAIGVRSRRQSAISALCGLRQSYFDPTGQPEDPLGYTVDPAAFAAWVDALLGAAHASDGPALPPTSEFG
jgi:capsular polysaccharide biosynthesis protein